MTETDRTFAAGQPVAWHPEEMRAAIDLSVGSSISFKATARAIPAGLVAAALLITAVLVPAVLLTKAHR